MFSKLFGLVLFGTSALLMFSMQQKLSTSYNTAKPQVLASVSDTKLVNKPIDLNQLHADINSKRATLGQATINTDIRLVDVARARASDMAEKGYFSHRGQDTLYYYDLLDKQNIERGFSCENLAIVFGTDYQKALTDWLTSESHNKCLFDSRHTSAGYAAASLGPVNKGGTEKNAIVIVGVFAELAAATN